MSSAKGSLIQMPKRTTKSERQDKASSARVLASTILKGWDLWAAVGTGIVFAVVGHAGLLVGDRAVLGVLGGACLTVGLGVWIAERWLSDRLQSTDYGEIVGIVDPDHSAAAGPYIVTIVVAVIASASSFLGAIVVERVQAPAAAAAFYGFIAFVVTWTFLAFLSLALVHRRHSRRAALVSSIRQQFEARRRDAERGEDGSRSP